MKKYWRGDFNWKGQTFTLYTSAPSREKAFQRMMARLSKKIGYNFNRVMLHYCYYEGQYDLILIDRK